MSDKNLQKIKSDLKYLKSEGFISDYKFENKNDYMIDVYIINNKPIDHIHINFICTESYHKI